jgi:hypothetical protein
LPVDQARPQNKTGLPRSDANRFAESEVVHWEKATTMRGTASPLFELFPSYPQHFDKLMIPLFFWKFDAHLW